MGLPEPVSDRRAVVARLAALVEAIEGRERGGERPRRGAGPVTGWPAVDGVLASEGGLPRSRLHEWLGVDDGPDDESKGAGEGRPRWSPPLSILRHLADLALRGDADEGGDPRGQLVVWIGRRLWPYPPSLARARPTPTWEALRGDRGGDLLRRSVFVDPGDDARRLWAIDLVLRCPSVAAVVADARRLSMAASRRLQLAAESGSALALLARPASERGMPSVAATRWLVRRGDGDAPAWTVEVLRRKSARALRTTSFADVGPGLGHEVGHGVGADGAGAPTLEWDHASSAVVERPRPARGTAVAEAPDAALRAVVRRGSGRA